MAAPIIRFEAVSKYYGRVPAVADVSLAVNEGEFFALLGPSGCGKTSLLRMLAGFDMPDAGRIFIDGQDVTGVAPQHRPVNMVFQNYAVFPHMTVADNVGYGLKVAGVAATERARRVAEALALVKLDGLDRRLPDQLSGGQRQRVALARALVNRPRVLLLDEPLSALDAKLRAAMRTELCQLQQQVGITFVMVTHDQDEALALADRCAVMHAGVLQQVASPADLYETPANRFVADFIGSVNLWEGTLLANTPTHAEVAVPGLPQPVFVDHGGSGPVAGTAGTTVWLALRPERIELHKPVPAPGDAPLGRNTVAGTICHIAYLGSSSLFEVALADGRRVKAQRSNLARRGQPEFQLHEPVWLAWPAGAPAVLLA